MKARIPTQNDPEDGGWQEPKPSTAAIFSTGPEQPRGEGHPLYRSVIEDLWELHKRKSGGYGTNNDPFANFTAVAAVSGRARYDYPIDRMIEKLTRAKSLIAQGRVDLLGEEFGDVAGLAVCAEVMRREDEAL